MKTVYDDQQEPAILLNTAEVGLLISLINQRTLKATAEGAPDDDPSNIFRQELVHKLMTIRERARATGELIKLETYSA